MSRRPDVDDLVSRARARETRSVARLISLVETESDLLPQISAALVPFAGHAHVVGLTGAPGVGKSTTTSALVGALRAQGRRVGVLAVDPSSPYSGGALLGDRIRMTEHSTDPDVFIRSMASRGHLGGLSWAAPHAIRVLDAAGFDVVLLETVGVGQSEVEVAGLADSTVVLLAPGMGDGIQAAKAGILEVGDVFCINKADRDGAATTRRELRSALAMGAGHGEPGAWQPPIELTVASRAEGIDALVQRLDEHRAHLEASGEGEARRVARVRREVEAIALAEVSREFRARGSVLLDEIAQDVVHGGTDPFTAARALREATRSAPPE